MFGNINEFIQKFQEKKNRFPRVLDVGSYDVNGSVRKILNPETYNEFIGIDMREGPGVDMVVNGHDIPAHFPHESFDLVTCCETLEHDDKFWVTVENMRNVLKVGGWMIITVPGIFFPKHDFPSDFYRFTEEAVKTFYEGFDNVHIEYYENKLQETDRKDNSIFSYGRKVK